MPDQVPAATEPEFGSFDIKVPLNAYVCGSAEVGPLPAGTYEAKSLAEYEALVHLCGVPAPGIFGTTGPMAEVLSGPTAAVTPAPAAAAAPGDSWLPGPAPAAKTTSPAGPAAGAASSAPAGEGTATTPAPPAPTKLGSDH